MKTANQHSVSHRISILVLCCSSLAAVASCALPQAALDQAADAEGLVKQLQVESDNMIAHQQALAQQRQAVLETLQDKLATTSLDGTDDYGPLWKVADVPDRANLYAGLRAEAAAHSASAAALPSVLTAIHAHVEALITPPPSSSKASTAVQKELHALSLQRTNKEDRDFLLAYAKAVRSDIEADKKKANDLAASAAKAASAAASAS